MIELKGINKKFEDIAALTDVSGEIREGSVFGLIGTNGAGKSTCLRLISGVLRPDTGEVLVDGRNVYRDEQIRRELFFISDDPYYFPNAAPRDMMRYYAAYYEEYDRRRFSELMKKFGLDENRRIHTFSKGMKKQLFVILGICANTKYLLCDETFDGLDPVMRQAVKGLIASAVAEGRLVPIIASHNLRELEDICDHVGVLHQGKVVLNMRLEQIQDDIHKVQCAFQERPQREWFDHLQPLEFKAQGRFCTLIAKAPQEKVLEAVRAHQPLFLETMPLTLEEIFIAQMGGIGYEVQSILV